MKFIEFVKLREASSVHHYMVNTPNPNNPASYQIKLIEPTDFEKEKVKIRQPQKTWLIPVKNGRWVWPSEMSQQEQDGVIYAWAHQYQEPKEFKYEDPDDEYITGLSPAIWTSYGKPKPGYAEAPTRVLSPKQP